MSARVPIQSAFKAILLRRVGSWSSKLSADDVEKLLIWAGKILPSQDMRAQANGLHHALTTYDGAGKMARGFFDLAPNVRRRFIENLLVNWGVVGGAVRYDTVEKERWLPPAFGVISPTMRCNLRCEGCYAYQYRRAGELSTEEFDSIITQCKDLGIYFFTISGGEPFVREDLFDMMEKHHDAFFQIYTNGTLIDDRVADRLLDLGNGAPAISVEGHEMETDARRGKGTYRRILAAMKRLRERELLFGISATVTRHNSDVLQSDEFFDYYCDQGARFAWLFQYIPIGREPNIDLMSTPEQRTSLRHRVKELRASKPIFIGDFWNDGEYVGGCMAGGRLYFHVTSNGNVEPCVFCHFTVGNIREKPLKEILSCDFFKALRYEQPYSDNKNLFTPCVIIDNPQILRDLVKEYGAKPSHEGAETIIQDPAIVRHLDAYSARMKELADPEWRELHYDNPDSEWHRDGERIVRQWALERKYLEAWFNRRHPNGRQDEPVHKSEHVRAGAP